MHTRNSRFLSVAIVAALVLAACGDSEESGGGTATDVSTALPTETAPATDVADTAPQATDVPVTEPIETDPIETDPAVSEPAVTEPAPSAPPVTDAPAVTTPASAPPTLRATGIGPLDFGTATPDDVATYLTPLLGSAPAVTSTQYSDDTGTYFENTVVEAGFAFPFGRTDCYSNELCVEFGGADGASLTLVGYRQNEGSGALATASGVTAGSRGVDFATVIVTEAGGCFSTGGGSADGVPLFLVSSGTPFESYDPDTATYTSSAPPVAEVTVLSVFAGEEPFYLYEDC